jgi:hypothetical protein
MNSEEIRFFFPTAGRGLLEVIMKRLVLLTEVNNETPLLG